jgi:GT2 family glycosyltransferase
MKIHILTLNWNGNKWLNTLKDGLSDNVRVLTMVGRGESRHFHAPYGDPKQQWEQSIWYIRDHGSKDGSLETIKSWEFDDLSPVRVKLFEMGHNRGSFASGMNFLFEQANPADDDRVLLLNNDVDMKFNDALAEMDWIRQKANADVVGCQLLYMGTSKIQHAGVIFSKRYNYMPYHYRPGENSDVESGKPRYFQAVTAAVCLINPIAFRKVGGFDEKFRWAFDDVDLCLRIGKLKERNIAYSGLPAYHEESASLKRNPVNKMFMGRNAAYFKAKWSGQYEIDHDKYLNDPNYNEIKI